MHGHKTGKPLGTASVRGARDRKIQYRTYRLQDTEGEFVEWARREVPLIPETERIVCVTDEQLAGWRPSDVALEDSRDFTV
jgi:hypothetical protein